MFFILSKIFGIFCSPLIWVMVLLILSFVAKKDNLKKKLRVVSIVILLIFSNQAIFYEVVKLWNIDPTRNSSLNQKYSIAIILGGMVSLDRRNKQVEFYENADRVFGVLPLYFGGKVDKILISGGSGRVFDKTIESTILQDYLVKIGVSRQDIIIEERSRNTYENALYTAEILKELDLQPPYLLSTSAMHMRRAQLCFKKLKVNIQPFSQDQKIYEREFTIDTLLLPNAKILHYWYQLFHEWLGMVTYKIKGYI